MEFFLPPNALHSSWLYHILYVLLRPEQEQWAEASYLKESYNETEALLHIHKHQNQNKRVWS